MDWQRKAEFVRMVAQGQSTGTITEALWQHIQEVLKFLKLAAQDGSAWLKQHVAEIEERVNGLKVEKGKADAPTKKETPSNKKVSTLETTAP